MMKKVLFFLLTIVSISIFSQADTLKLGDKYWEDQLYISVSYDVLRDQPSGISSSGFSYNLSAGYIKDIPFDRKGNFAAGIGVGYGFNSFNHGLQVLNTNSVQAATNISSNTIKLNNIEFPIQLRWRNSDALTYSFWRVYAGVKLSYNLNNKFSYVENGQTKTFSNIAIFNRFQTGLELSAGYGAINFYVYYGLSPIYKNVAINNQSVNTKIAKFGLIFYLL